MALRTLFGGPLLDRCRGRRRRHRTPCGRRRGGQGDGHHRSITYSYARNGAFGQSKSIGEPMGPVNLTQITQYGPLTSRR